MDREGELQMEDANDKTSEVATSGCDKSLPANGRLDSQQSERISTEGNQRDNQPENDGLEEVELEERVGGRFLAPTTTSISANGSSLLKKGDRSKSLVPCNNETGVQVLSYVSINGFRGDPAINKTSDGAMIIRTGGDRQVSGNEGSSEKAGGGKQAAGSGFIRHMVAVLALSSILLANMNRQAFNQALVSMTRPIPAPDSGVNATLIGNQSALEGTTNGYPTAETTTLVTEATTTTLRPETTTTNSMPSSTIQPNPNEFDDKFDWTGDQIAILQAAFSYGYTPFMIPGGRLSEVYGAKWIVFLSGFGSALCCILSPFLADTNYNLLVASRVIMGLSQTGVSPALYALLTRWLPPEESSVYLPMIKVGVMVGFMAGSLVSGFFTWRMTFYLVGVTGLLWSLLWALVGISRLNKGRQQSASASRKASAPWLRILSNEVVVGFMLAKFTVKLSTEAQTTQIPMYLKNVFHVSKEVNGMLSALNFAIQSIFTGLVAWLAKEFVVRQSFGFSKTGVRRLFQGICNFGMALAYILITANMSSLAVVCCAVVLLSVAAMFGAGGEAVTPIDLSTEYSASIMAIANSAANLSGILLPWMVSRILGEQLGSSDNWNMVWWMVGGISMAGGLIYVLTISAEIQNFGPKQADEKEKGDKQLKTAVGRLMASTGGLKET